MSIKEFFQLSLLMISILSIIFLCTLPHTKFGGWEGRGQTSLTENFSSFFFNMYFFTLISYDNPIFATTQGGIHKSDQEGQFGCLPDRYHNITWFHPLSIYIRTRKLEAYFSCYVMKKDNYNVILDFLVIIIT